jgi:hypothetical protein
MPTYKVIMTRVYETIFEFEASSNEDALSQFEAMDDTNKFATELEQCCVIEDKYEVELSSRVGEWKSKIPV